MNEKLLTILGALLQNNEIIQPETPFEDILDFDSMVHVSLMVDIEREFKISIPVEVFGEFTCLNDISKYIDSI